MLMFTHQIGGDTVNSDSVNLGSNPSSPATLKAHEMGVSGGFGPVERAAKSEQNEYPRSTEPGTVSDSDIPTEPKAFEDWLDDQEASWPQHLRDLGYYALLALKARDQSAWDQSFALRKICKADWSAFTDALAAYRAEVRS